MDPFEEFEFKPLTDGLGFHKNKATAAKADGEVDTFTSQKFIKDQGLSLIEESAVDPLRPPLPRKKASTPMAPTAGSLTEVGGDGSTTSTAVDEILKTLQKNRRIDFEEKTAKSKITAAATKEEFKATTWNFSSALLDSMLVIAASLLCMIILLVITKVDLVGNLTHPDDEGMIYIATVAMFAVVAFIYLTVNRIFMGCTPGEWAFDQRIGKPLELNQATYGLKVAARSAIVVLTGFIVFPFISALLGRDLAGSITGAKLYKKV